MSHTDVNHYASIVAVLLAGDVQARIVGHADYSAIEVKTPDGDRIIWGNTAQQMWAFTMVTAEGETKTGVGDLAVDALPEEVALMMVHSSSS